MHKLTTNEQTTPTYSKLKHLSVINITGIDAKKFLQGQVTCDVNSIPLGGQSLSALCNHKGRVLAIFELIAKDENNYWLIVSSDMAQATLEVLKKPAIFSKLALTINQDLMIISITNINQPLQEMIQKHSPYLVLNKEHNLTDVYFHTENKNLIQELTNIAKEVEDLSLLHKIRHKIPTITTLTSAEFLPHNLNLDSLGALSFNKGCYCGQEIIARMQYLGNVKKHTYYFTANNNNSNQDQEPRPNDTITIDEQEVGTIINMAKNQQNNYELLVMLNDQAANSNRLYLPNSKIFLKNN